jgi:hypothetical protein
MDGFIDGVSQMLLGYILLLPVDTPSAFSVSVGWPQQGGLKFRIGILSWLLAFLRFSTVNTWFAFKTVLTTSVVSIQMVEFSSRLLSDIGLIIGLMRNLGLKIVRIPLKIAFFTLFSAEL